MINEISSWDHYDGTSMTTPHTAGVAARIWSSNLALTANDVETKLKNGRRQGRGGLRHDLRLRRPAATPGLFFGKSNRADL